MGGHKSRQSTKATAPHTKEACGSSGRLDEKLIADMQREHVAEISDLAHELEDKADENAELLAQVKSLSKGL